MSRESGDDPRPGQVGLARRLLRFLFPVEDGEWSVLIWSFLYVFLLFASYYIVRPIREEMGITQGAIHLPGLFLITLAMMPLFHVLFAALVSRYPRRVFVPVLYRVIAGTILLFAVLFRFLDPSGEVWLARAFYVWVSIYNLFAVSVFWGLMADCFRSQQGKRLYPFIAAGGTIGALTGAGLTSAAVGSVGPIVLLVVSAVLLEAGVHCARRIDRLPQSPAPPVDSPRSLLRGATEGIERVLKSPYLLAICLFMGLYTFTSSALYFERANIIEASSLQSAERVRLFANIDLAIQSLALFGQVFLAGHVIRWLGLRLALPLVPLLTAGGFALLSIQPTLQVVVLFEVLRKALNYAVTRPCREVLYTVVDRAEKFKSKSFIDTFVYRAGDASAALYQIATHGIILLAVPISVLWLVVGFVLGRSQEKRAEAATAAAGRDGG